MLQYYREYRAMRHIAFDLLSKGKPLETDFPIEAAIADATECEIERPKKRQNYYSGKKRHTFKFQIIADARAQDVICISTASGRKHDFTLLKDSCVHFSPKTEVLAEKGYLGIANLHENSATPVKSSKNHKLTAKERKNNASISKCRIYIEYINRLH